MRFVRSTEPQRSARSTIRRGFTLVELLIALTIVTIILAATSVTLQREAENVSNMQQLTNSERAVQTVLSKIEDRLDFGQGIDPVTSVVGGISSVDTGSLALAETLGFPFEGTLLVDPGGIGEERIEYADLVPGASEVRNLTRGVKGTSAAAHAGGTLALWEGAAFPIEDQVGPGADEFDGRTDDLRGPLFYRGDGIGFAYRRPVDPAGTGSYMDGGGIRWGATITGTDSEDACAAIAFRPVARISEAVRGWDLNNDGDLVDTFDLGRICDLGWDAVDPTRGTSSLDLVSAIFLQEVDNYGGDLDGDGFDDPMFLWTAASGRLRIRLFALLGDVGGRDVVRRFETVLYLRNGAAE